MATLYFMRVTAALRFDAVGFRQTLEAT